MAYSNTDVQVFFWSDSGVTTSWFGSAAGSVIAGLDACLLNGYGSVTLDSLVVSSGIATGTLSTGHNFTPIDKTTSTGTGQIIRIAGVTDKTDLNADWRITITSSTTFTMECPLISDGSASGTITAKIAPAPGGWTNPYSGTNIEVYRNGDATSAQPYLRIDNTTSNYFRVRGYMSMSDSTDSGDDPFPTDAQVSGGAYAQSFGATTGRPWIVIATKRSLVMMTDYSNNGYWYCSWGFMCPGELYSASDAYAAWLVAHSSNSYSASNDLRTMGNSFCWAPRNMANATGATQPYRYSIVKSSNYPWYETSDAADPASGVIFHTPVCVFDSTNVFRASEELVFIGNGGFSSTADVAGLSLGYDKFYQVGSGTQIGQIYLTIHSGGTTSAITVRVA